MRILLVKTSSLGDVIHNLPVVSDILRCFPGSQIDWCVEAPFQEIPLLHPGIHDVIPVAIRRWRRALLRNTTWHEFKAFHTHIGALPYSKIIDTQGLLKSAMLSRFATGERHGYDKKSIREPLACCFYDRRHRVPTQLHAVQRNRQLAAQALGYSELLSTLPLDYGLQIARAHTSDRSITPPYAVLLTATSRDDKLWSESNWINLGLRLARTGTLVRLVAGNAIERARAERIASAVPGASVFPPSSIASLADELARARLVIGVDTGLTHLGAALSRPTVAIYASTDPGLTGVLGTGNFRNLGSSGQPPSLDEVWDTCCTLLAQQY